MKETNTGIRQITGDGSRKPVEVPYPPREPEINPAEPLPTLQPEKTPEIMPGKEPLTQPAHEPTPIPPLPERASYLATPRIPGTWEPGRPGTPLQP